MLIIVKNLELVSTLNHCSFLNMNYRPYRYYLLETLVLSYQLLLFFSLLLTNGDVKIKLHSHVCIFFAASLSSICQVLIKDAHINTTYFIRAYCIDWYLLLIPRMINRYSLEEPSDKLNKLHLRNLLPLSLGTIHYATGLTYFDMARTLRKSKVQFY